MGSEIHYYDKILHSAIESIKRNEYLSEVNKNIIFQFSDFCLATGLTKARAAKYIHSLGTLKTKSQQLYTTKNYPKNKKKNWRFRFYDR